MTPFLHKFYWTENRTIKNYDFCCIQIVVAVVKYIKKSIFQIHIPTIKTIKTINARSAHIKRHHDSTDNGTPTITMRRWKQWSTTAINIQIGLACNWIFSIKVFLAFSLSNQFWQVHFSINLLIFSFRQFQFILPQANRSKWRSAIAHRGSALKKRCKLLF